MIALKRLLTPMAGAAFVFALAATPLTAKAETLRMANWLPPFHHMTKTLANWVAEVDKASGGTLKIVVLKAPLAKPPGQYDLLPNRDRAWFRSDLVRRDRGDGRRDGPDLAADRHERLRHQGHGA